MTRDSRISDMHINKRPICKPNKKCPEHVSWKRSTRTSDVDSEVTSSWRGNTEEGDALMNGNKSGVM